MMYRHAMWPPSQAWPQGFLYGARVEEFERDFPRKLEELGLPLRVWDSLPSR